MKAKYNERSWAIDLIGHIKLISCTINRVIKDAGGEHSINTGSESLFPDVLLFGDKANASILQGWELKMPDTKIDDLEFYNNAKKKAITLGLNSFVLWNVSCARLFLKDTQTGDFVVIKEWDDLKYVVKREDVISNKLNWEKLAEKILLFINDLLENGKILGKDFVESYKNGGIPAIILENAPDLASKLSQEIKHNSDFRNKITIWWELYESEYERDKKEIVLAKSIITNWIVKFIFSNLLREHDLRAKIVENIRINTSPEEALIIFKQLSEECNFWTVFSHSLGLEKITDRAWTQLLEFNQLLCDLNIGSIDQSQLSELLEATVDVSVRKVKGQYSTPKSVAKLLVHLCIRDIPQSRFLDPCCGSGTIAREAIALKSEYNTDYQTISKTIYASDLDAHSVQISSLSLVNPAFFDLPLRLFSQDVFELTNDSTVEFRNPSNGKKFSEKLAEFDAIATNLPFISQGGRKLYLSSLNKAMQLFPKEQKMSMKADISAYIPFVLAGLLKEEGRLGIVITNAWLGTDWGNQFFENLMKSFQVRYVLTSGKGRWFKNAEIVANIIILDKSNSQNDHSNIKFVVLNDYIDALDEKGKIDFLSSKIQDERKSDSLVSIREVSYEKVLKFKKFGLSGNAQFVNCDWVLDLPLMPLNKVFDVYRGERRGLNDMFYPEGSHQIENYYLKPLIKNSKSFITPQVSADRNAFSCDKSLEELKAINHTGALSWINRFGTDDNIRKLSKKGLFWYQMDANNLGELVMFVNPGDRLFTGRVNPPAFVDQRLIVLKPKVNLDVDFFHALLNSAIVYFFIEGLGFGRGAGVLDLSSDRVKKYMHILDYSILDNHAMQNIISLYAPIKDRRILPLEQELKQSDRRIFDEYIISAFSLNVSLEEVYSSLIHLFHLRKAVKDDKSL